MTDRTVITTRGLQLLARLASGAEQLEFTGVKVGTGIVPDGTDPAQLMHLVSYKMDGMIADYGYDQETDDAFVVMQITNAGITSGFVMTEVGLFAMDPDRGEILYAYVDLSEDPNYIMPEENGRAKTVQIKMHVVVGEAADITATINPLSQVTMEAFQRELGKKTDSEGGDISDAVAGFETPGAEIKYPELEPGGSVKGILGGIRRWLETLKKEKVTADGGEAGETTATFEDYTGANPAPSVETALAGIRSKGKTGNILSNIKAALMGLVTLGEMRKYLVNNGLCTEPGKFFLDAAYGKTLMDEITRLNGELGIKMVTLTGNNSLVLLIRISDFTFGYIHKTPAISGKEAVSIGKQNLISNSAVPCDVGDPTRRWNIYVNVTNGEVTLRNQTSDSIGNAYYKGCFILHQTK